MSFQIRTMFPGGAQGVVCVLVDGSRRALPRDGIAAIPPRVPSIAGAASAPIHGATAIAEARRMRTRTCRARTNAD